MTSKELREKFIKFFEEKGHKSIPSYPLVPQDDPSVLFTTAGMHPLVPYLMGEKHPLGKRLTDVQKCLRTGDIDEIGNVQHLSFFEMLGYWSLGDYFKKESIHFTYDFFTKVMGIAKDNISVSVFEGDEDAPFDEESYNTWKDEIKIPEDRIYKYNKKENWWGPVSDTGPCGPCTEMFIDTCIEACGPDCGPSCDCDKFVEIGNNVFMEYFKNKKGKFERLEQKNVDVGLGFERLVMFSQGKKTVFETDLFEPIVRKIQELSTKANEKSVRRIADHMRAATFALAEGVEPSNIDRGYVVRRLIRRAVRHGRILGIEGSFASSVAKEVISKMGDVYTELKDNEKFIYSEIEKEEGKFQQSLDWVEQYRIDLEEALNHKVAKRIKEYPIINPNGKASGYYVYENFQTYGVPPDLSQEVVKELGLEFDQEEYDEAFKGHQELSRKGAEKKFKGGLGEVSEKTTKYHTATHLLHEALRRVLGNHVYQRGSNITEERMRFDFSHPDKMTEEEIQKVEDIVNKQISASLPVVETITTVEEAKGEGAIGIFDGKYGEKVKVYSIGGPLDSPEAFSKEICGGPHIENTSEIGKFKITKEESSSQGVRRIKAALE